MDVGMAQFAIGATVVIIAFTLVARQRWHNAYASLPDGQKRRKAELRGQIEAGKPATIRIPDTANLESYRDDVDALFKGRDAEPERETIRSALGTVHSTLTSSVRNRTESLPRTSIALAEEALLLLVFGAIVFVPSSAIVDAFETGEFSLSGMLNASVDAVRELIDLSITVAATFPFSDVWWALLVTIFVQGGSALYEHWLVTSTTLFLIAAVLVFASRRVPDDVEAHVFGSVASPALATCAALAIVYALGVIPVLVLSAAGYATAGAYIGLASSVLGGLVLGVVAAGWTYNRIRALGRGRSLDKETAAYVVLDRAGVGMGVLLAPIVAIYIVRAIVEGHLTDTVTAVATGPLPLQMLILGSVVLGLVAIARGSRGAWGDLRAGLAETLSRQAVRSALLGRGLPVSILVFATLLGMGLGAPAWLAAVVAAVLAAIARIGFVVAHRARRRVRAFEPRTTTASRLVISAYTLDTGDEDVYYARVNTVPVARTDQDAAVDAIFDVGEQLFEAGEADPSVAQEFARDLLELGFEDERETVNRLRTTLKEELADEFERKDGVVPEGEFRDDVDDDVPESIVDERLDEWVRHQQILKRGDYLHRV